MIAPTRRKVVLEVRFVRVELAAPNSGSYKGSSQLVYAVEAKEVSSDPALHQQGSRCTGAC